MGGAEENRRPPAYAEQGREGQSANELEHRDSDREGLRVKAAPLEALDLC